jgi:diguanylate cyclase (GGDEF)-like protein/putative nucleotidyltransferase with HDIG domain
VPILIFTIVYFSLNSWLVAFAIALERNISASVVWKHNFAWLSLNYFGGASVATLLVSYTRNIDFTYLAFVLPLLAVLYVTFAVSMGRVEDANRHLSQLNRLYMSTIETLAMAIDAKDQITHGHIRRVQHLSVGLAKALGIQEEEQIKAIEAASLLHDMGKLAVPEYILNKPGPLTPAEFEKMKLHASVGADILSSIEFPYPVVPIVRHHHENWDGTGYPGGLKGSQIPIGARVLAVADCYDALTSDRPYRPRLADTEALNIVRDRRGTMYDPLVVDTFMRVHTSLAPSSEIVEESSHGLSAITRGLKTPDRISPTADRFEDISASTEEMLVLYDLARSLTGRFDLADAGDIIAKHLRRMIPASTCVFFVYDEDSDEVIAAHASGEHATHFRGIRIPRGQRLTGWVVANKQTIVNSDPMLDLGDSCRTLQPRLMSCMSTPLATEVAVVGALSIYSVTRDSFTDDHRRILEAIARQVSQTVKHAVEFHEHRTRSLRDAATGLPNAQHLERFVSSEMSSASRVVPFVLIYVGWEFSSPVRTIDPHDLRSVLLSVSQVVQQTLRGGDILFRYSDGELVALLTQTTADEGLAVAKRVSGELRRMGKQPPLGGRLSLRIGTAAAPADGERADSLVHHARHESSEVGNDPIGQSTSVH